MTLTALFYLEEDWRGKRAWENCKHEAEARGAVLDWEKYIPTPVPDDQNFFMASTNLLQRFKKAQGDVETKLAAQNPWLRITYASNSFPVFDNTKAAPLVVAVINISPVAATEPANRSPNLVLKFGEPNVPERGQELIQKTVGRSVHGPVGIEFSELQLSNVSPVRILLETDETPPMSALETLLPQDLDTNFGQLSIQATGKDTYQVWLTGVHVTAAADYLKWSDQFEPAFNEVREALKRPYALLQGDYSQPYLVPVPNFVAMRSVAQTLSQRAQCDFLLNQPDKALRELTLVHDICRILRRPPAGRPITLVESMINVAIAGLYASIIEDGLRLHAWREPQLAALQKQLKEDDLLSLVVDSLNSEQASAARTMIKMPAPDVQKQLWGDFLKTLWEKVSNPTYWYLNYGPQGWLYQNAAGHIARMQGGIRAYDISNQLIDPRAFRDWAKSLSLSSFNPYSFMDALFLPNLTRATLVTAYNQTQVNEAMVACALERYRLAHGEYPEALDVLVPQFIEELPHDIIGGQPLHYRRTDEGKFILYSIGWDEKDDGGTVAFKGGSEDRENGDWIWKN